MVPNYSFLDMLKCSRLPVVQTVVSQPQSATDPADEVGNSIGRGFGCEKVGHSEEDREAGGYTLQS